MSPPLIPSVEDRITRQYATLLALTSQKRPDVTDVNTALQEISEASAQALHATRVSIWRYNVDRSAIVCIDLFDSVQGTHVSGTTLQAADYPNYFKALNEMDVIAADDALNDPVTREFTQDYLSPLDIRSMLDAPISLGGVRVGVLCHEQVGLQRHWAADEKTFAVTMANLATLVLERAERHDSEIALRESEQRFRELAETIEDVFWISEPDKNRILYVSPGYEKIWGCSCQSLYDSPKNWMDAIHPEDRERIKTLATSTQPDGDYDEEYRIVRPDGKIRWIRDRAFPVFDNKGDIQRVLGVARDITEHRKLQEQLVQSQKLDAIGQLAGGVAHDFNNLLTVIQGYSSLMLTFDPIPEELAEAAREITKASSRAAELTKQLLLFSRKQVMERGEWDLNEILSNLGTMLHRIIGENIHLELNLHTDPLLVYADLGMIEQVLMNLVVNARDAMPEGGQLIIETSEKVFTEKEVVALPEASLKPYICIRVSDTGCGIPPEILPHIFEPFYTTKDPCKGTGLGLATVFGVVKQHNGFLTVESEVDQGTTFRIYLLAEKTRTKVLSREDNSKSPPQGGTETILLVEDEPAVRMLTRVILERQGYHVLEAEHGVEALKIWEQHEEKIQLLLTDLMMPEGISGRELAQRLKVRRPDLRIIFTSGYSPDIAGKDFQLQEGQNFIQKPASSNQLLHVVRQCLDT